MADFSPFEAAPCTMLYRSIGRDGAERARRPNLQDMLRGELDRQRRASQADGVTAAGAAQGNGPTKLGWQEGVLVPCLLNIWGVIMFLRMGWVVGQAGVGLGILIIVAANVVTTITALSMCAVCSNGEVKGGGAYFLISRALGPEFGGSIGLLFYCAQAIAVAMYAIGFAESLTGMLTQQGLGTLTGDVATDVSIVAVITIVLLLGVALIGIGWYAKCQVGLLTVLVVAIASVYSGAFLPELPSVEANAAAGFVGWSGAGLRENFAPAFSVDATTGITYSFSTVFAVFFPAVTGIMAGANMSGDLANPSDAIPRGTLLAIIVTGISYIILAVLLGATCSREQVRGRE